MKIYSNVSGKSGVSAYEVGPDFINVKFNSGKIYSYNIASAGIQNIEVIKTLAKNGEGLNRFIKNNVNDKFVK